MFGPFGGALEVREGEALESVPAELLDRLAGEPASIPGLVAVRAAGGLLRIEGDLRGLAPLATDQLRALAEAAKALLPLHEQGKAHGDLRPGHIWTGPGGTVVTLPNVPDARALLRTRLALGADARDVAFVAPEVLAGGSPTVAADVYAIGAIAYWVLSGRHPLGRANLASPGPLSRLVYAALEASPSARPTLEAFAAALDRAAPARVAPVATPAPAAGGPILRVRVVAPPSPSPAPAPPPETEEERLEKDEAARRRRETPVILNVLLGLGVLLVLTGALWLVAASWNALGEWGRFGLLVLLTGGIGAAGRGLEVKGNARSGFALIVLASQLLWAVGADLLVITGQNDEPGLWAFIAGCVAAVGYGLALKRGSVLLGVLASLGAILCVAFTWSALGPVGRAMFLSIATVGLAASALQLERRGHKGAPAVHFVWTQLVWLCGFYILGAADSHEPGPWSLVATAAAGAALWVAIRRQSIFFSIAGSFAASVALLLLGIALKRGTPEGPVLWSALSWITLLLLSLGLRAKAGSGVGAPAALFSGLWFVASFGIALDKHGPHDLGQLSIVFPYVLAAAALGGAAALGRAPAWRYGLLALAMLVLVATPVFHAHENRWVPDVYRHGAALAGAAAILAALLWPALREALPVQVLALAAGVAHVSAARSPGLTASAIALAFGFHAVRLRSPGLSAVGALAAGIAAIGFGHDLELATALAKAEAALGTAGLLLAIALVVRGRSDDVVAAPFGAVAAIAVATSAALAALPVRHVVAPFEVRVGWPYLAGALAVATALGFHLRQLEPWRLGALVTGTFVLAAAPVYHASMGDLPRTYYQACGAVGAALLLGAFPLAARPTLHAAVAIVGLAHLAGTRSPGAAAGGWAFVLLGSAIRLDSAPVSLLGTIAVGVGVGFGADELRFTRDVEALAAWVFGGALVLAGASALARRLGADAAAPAPAAGAVLAALASYAIGLAAIPHESALSVTWPYVIGGLAALLAFRASGAEAGLALATALLVLGSGPTIHALAHPKSPAYLYAVSISGTLIVVAAFRAPRLAANAGLQLLAIVAGLANIATAPTILALARLFDRDGDALFLEVMDPALTLADRLQHPLFYLPYLCVTAGLLVLLGVVFAQGSARKLPYRLLEVAGLLIFFGTLSLLAMVRWREFLYPAVLFGGGFLSIAAGAWRRHALLVVVPAVVLVVQAWFQYFAKLHGALPIGLLLVGFGLSLLGGGVYFEKRVRPRLGLLKEWA